MAAWRKFDGSTVARPGRTTISVALKMATMRLTGPTEQLNLYYVKLLETLQKVIAQKYGPG
jgi:hypothetical protein